MKHRIEDVGAHRRARFLAMTLWTAAALSMFWLIFDIAFGLRPIVASTLGSYVLVCSCLIAARRKMGHALTAVTTSTVLLAGTLFVTFLVGTQIGTHFYLLGVAMLPMLFVPLDTYLAAVLGHLALAVTLFVCFEVGAIAPQPLVDVSAEVGTIASWLNPTLSLFLLLGLVSTFIAELVHAEKRLAVAREEADSLLRNVLPEDIASRLKQGHTQIADGHPMVTVVFSDIVGFTALAEKSSPAELVRILDEMVTHFDRLCAEYGIEKIKTIGDAYMAVGGLRGDSASGAQYAVAFALAVRDFIRDQGAKWADPALQVRLGVHSGPVVAGVIGKHKFSYDLWGDTVNTAARMETHGVEGQVHVSHATRVLIEDAFVLEPRGTVELKGKSPVETWFVVSRRPKHQATVSANNQVTTTV